MKIRIVIDYQGAQSGGSRTRGIGRYTASITRALIAAAADSADVILLLNGAFAETIDPIRREFAGVLPRENVVVWQPLEGIGHIRQENAARRRASELLREAVIARLKPDAVLITSHFEGSGDDGATTVGLLPASYPTAVILYDLIPYIYRSIYLSTPAVERWYEDRLGSLMRADLLLAISESSRQEAVDYLGYPADRAVSVSTAADPHFHRVELSNLERKELFARYGIAKPFVMYTGGIDHRKNIEGLIRAFRMLPAAVRSKHQLAVVCSMRPEDGPRLREIARAAGLAPDVLVLTGFVPEDDLVALYSNCKLFVFPSWHEGFGLPALEAMRCGAPVIASDRSSLPEVVGCADALFDPHQDQSISDKMRQALTDEAFRERLIANGSERASLFSWDAIGQRALGAIQEAITRWRAEHPAPSSPPARPRLAMVTPAPPAQSGIAYYAATLIRALSRFYQIDLVLKDGLSTDDPFILANCSVLDASTFRGRYSEYDRVVYHFGNSDHHSHMVDLIADCPGVVVLHDYFVSDLSSWREHLGGVEGNWGYDLYESHGIGALLERHSEPDLFKVINKYPCSYAVTRHAASVLCHSEEARALQIEWHGSEAARDWRVVPMIRTKPKLPPRSQARRELNVADDEFLVCAFGILGRSKLNHRLIEAWMSSRLGTNNKCRLVFVGGHGPEDYYNELTAKVRQSGAAAQVGFSGWVDEATYWRYLSAADVAVQLRGLTHGETSAATLDAMLAGLAVVANRSSVLSKEADHAIAYIAADAPAEELAETLDRLHRDTAVRSRLGSAAQAYATANHSESSCGETFRAAVEHASTTSMSALNAAVDGIATLDLSPQEAAHIADVLAAAVDQRAAMVVDVTSLISELPDQFAFTLGPLLSRLAQLQPRLRVVAVEDRAGEYWSVMDNIRRAALYPHIHRAPERVLLKSVDWLVSLHPADADVARQAAARSGADHLALTMDDRSDPESLAVRIADFVRSTRSTREASFARYFDTAPDEGAPLRTFPGEPLPDRGKLRLNEMAR